jgi:putative NIF3 family GTP cyclohydrolase 1 type 2
MKAREVADVFEQIAPVSSGIAADLDSNFLGFRFGNPDVEVTGVGVAWWMSEEVVEAAVAKRLNLLLCHEPELFRWYKSPWHTNRLPETMPYNLRKMKRLLDHDICVYTAHSNWDLQKEVGMEPTLAKALGFKEQIRRDVAVGIYRVGPMSFGQLITHVKTRMKLEMVGQTFLSAPNSQTGMSAPLLRVQGDPEMEVKTVVLGFGSIASEVEAIVANHCDAGIFGELREWSFIFARESRVGIIETGHCASESIGFRSVVVEMQKRLPGVRFEFLEIPPPFRIA